MKKLFVVSATFIIWLISGTSKAMFFNDSSEDEAIGAVELVKIPSHDELFKVPLAEQFLAIVGVSIKQVVKQSGKNGGFWPAIVHVWSELKKIDADVEEDAEPSQYGLVSISVLLNDLLTAYRDVDTGVGTNSLCQELESFRKEFNRRFMSRHGHKINPFQQCCYS